MSSNTKDDGKKWIQTSVTVTCLLLAYVLISFFTQMGEWFDLESKITQFNAISQIVSLLIALGVFVYIMKTPKTSDFLKEVYQEGVKVVWPDRSETVKHTVGIMIGVTIVGFILGFFDFVAGWLLNMVH